MSWKSSVNGFVLRDSTPTIPTIAKEIHLSLHVANEL
jgi:hypothetical protein